MAAQYPPQTGTGDGGLGLNQEPLVQAVSAPGPRIALIHALEQSVAPIAHAFERHWPEAQRMNLLDDSLASDVAHTGLDAAMHTRFERLAAYAEFSGAQAILYTCSAFGPCIEGVAVRRPDLTVLKPYQAMVAEALGLGGRIGLVASFAPTLEALPAEFGPNAQVLTACVPHALQALQRQDAAGHDASVLEAALHLQSQGCTLIALSQFSMARAAPLLRERLTLPVLTAPASAVLALRQRLLHEAAPAHQPHA